MFTGGQRVGPSKKKGGAVGLQVVSESSLCVFDLVRGNRSGRGRGRSSSERCHTNRRACVQPHVHQGSQTRLLRRQAWCDGHPCSQPEVATGSAVHIHECHLLSLISGTTRFVHTVVPCLSSLVRRLLYTQLCRAMSLHRLTHLASLALYDFRCDTS